MKLLVVSHPCVTALNQQFFAAVEQLTGWQVTLVVPRNWRNEYAPRITVARWPELRGELVQLPVLLPGQIPLHAYRGWLRRLLHEGQYDAIYIHHEPYAVGTAQFFWANARSLRAPIGFYSAQNLPKRYPPPFRQLERWVFSQAAFAFPCAQLVCDVLRHKGYKGSAAVLPLGIDPQRYQPWPGAEIREALGLTGTVVGYVGRLAEEKGLQTLLGAAALLPDLPLTLLFVGTGPYRQALEAQAHRLGLTDRLRFADYVPHAQVAPYYGAMDLFVLPSQSRPFWREQFGRVIIEALACGVPVIGSDSGEIPHLIGATGGGQLFPEGQPEALAAVIRQLAGDADLRQALARQGRGVVLERFTSERLAERFATVVEAAVRARTRHV